jgi:hypothetical protein
MKTRVLKKAAEIYRGEVSGLTSTTRGLQVPATRFTIAQIQEISRTMHSALFQNDAPNLWSWGLIDNLLDPDRSNRHRQFRLSNGRATSNIPSDRTSDPAPTPREMKMNVEEKERRGRRGILGGDQTKPRPKHKLRQSSCGT